jgi:hypothetical protein
VSEFENESVLVSLQARIVTRNTDRCGQLSAMRRSQTHTAGTEQLASLLSIGELHNLPVGEWQIFLNTQFSVLPAQKWRSQQIPAHKRERGSAAGFHG